MTRNKIADAEGKTLLDGKTYFYGSNKSEHGNGDGENKNSSPTSFHDEGIGFKRLSSSLKWVQASWARCMNILFWSWHTPILQLSFEQRLTQDDLTDLSYQDQCSLLLNKFLIYDWSTMSTWRIVFHAFGKQTFLVGLLLLPLIAARVAQPLFIYALVKHVTENHSNSYPMHVGIILAVGLFLSSVVQAFCRQHLVFLSKRLGMRIRNALVSTIYRHLLSISISSMQSTTAAQTINLLANDARKFEDLWAHIHFLWGAPLEGIIIFGLLCWIIGIIPALLAFTLLLLVIVPLQVLFTKYFSLFQQRTMACSDKRIKLYGEILDGCRIIKMYMWEKPMEQQLQKLREEELRNIKYASYLRAFNLGLLFVSPHLMALILVCSVWLFSYQLKVSDTFTALILFAQVRFSLTNLWPTAIEQLTAMLVADKRISAFMQLKRKVLQKRRSTISRQENKSNQPGTIVLSDASFSWDDHNPYLRSIDIDIKAGQFVGITGSVGAGKSSLLAAMLGEMNLWNGYIQTIGSVSYAAQSPWIVADTIRANILLGKSFDEERYTRILRGCCLDIDLKELGEAADLTVIGEKGVNLSGGQKARVSLARALYAEADIYLFDDPFSAVDSKVAKQIFDNCMGPQGLLREKTRVLVTHHIHFLSLCDQCFLLADGHIAKHGSFDELSMRNESRNLHGARIETRDQTIDNSEDATVDILDVSKSVIDQKSILLDEVSIDGRVNWSVCSRLFTAPPLGYFGLVLLILLLIVAEFFYDMTTYWLALWSKKPHIKQQKLSPFDYIFLGLTFCTIIASFVRANVWFCIMLRGAANQHKRMLKSILHTSMRFFESNSMGRILNRASRDQYVIDNVLPPTLFDAAQTSSNAVGSLITIVLINPWILIIVIPVLYLFCYLYHHFSRSNQQLKRLESQSRSPVYAFFVSSFNGLTTIRALRVKEDFLRTFIHLVDVNTRAYIPLINGTHWLGLRLELVGSLFLFLIAVVSIIMRDILGGSLIALTLKFSFNLITRLQWAARQYVEAENLMVSAERIDEYAHLPTEENNDGDRELTKTSADWPKYGRIQFQNYTLRYRPESDPVLKSLSFHVNSKEKVGIIGRTGTVICLFE